MTKKQYKGVSEPRSVVVTAALPVELGARLDRVSRMTGISKTRIMSDAIRARLDYMHVDKGVKNADGN